MKNIVSTAFLIVAVVALAGCSVNHVDRLQTVQKDCGTDYVRTLSGIGNDINFIAIDRKGNIVHYTICDNAVPQPYISRKEILFSLDGVNYTNGSIHLIPCPTNATENSVSSVPLERQ